MRILAVDDDPIILDLLQLALSNSAYNDFEFATSGAEALELLEDTEDPFGCFLLDINMPEMDGIELCEKIREYPEYEQTPIIMVTRLDHRTHLERAVRAGASDYVVKPFDNTEVITRIELAEVRRTLAPELALDAAKRRKINEGRLSDPFLLKDVPFAVGQQEMISSLGDLPAFMRLTFYSLKIVNAASLHARHSTEEFHQVVTRVGGAVAEALQNVDYMMSHQGNGIINIVVPGNKMLSMPRLERNINQNIGNMKQAGSPVPDVVIASAGAPQYVPRAERADHLRYAMKAVRQLAKQSHGNSHTRGSGLCLMTNAINASTDCRARS